jgi:hypothetical protein
MENKPHRCASGVSFVQQIPCGCHLANLFSPIYSFLSRLSNSYLVRPIGMVYWILALHEGGEG